MTQEVIPAGTETLDELAARANAEYDFAYEAGSKMVQHIIAAGEALMEARKQVPYGQWIKWVKQNYRCQPTTAEVHMRLAAYKDLVIAGQATTIRGALQMVTDAEPIDRKLNDRLISDARRMRREEGMQYHEIAAALGIPKARVYRYCNPKRVRQWQQNKARKTRAQIRAANRVARDEAMKKAPEGLSHAYSHLRKALQAAEKARANANKPEVRALIDSAMNRMAAAEDRLVGAEKAQ